MPLATSTPATEVLAVVRWLPQRDVTYQINSGWAVDALFGRQTRDHGDLDVFVDADAVPDLLEWLQDRGYSYVEDWRPIRIELASSTGRIDVHPMIIDTNGDGTQQGFGAQTFLHAAAERTTGTIDGIPVMVARPARRSGSGWPPAMHDCVSCERPTNCAPKTTTTSTSWRS